MNILTFDIEEWFLSRNDEKIPIDKWESFEQRVEVNTRRILDLLDHHQQKATFFILGWVAEKYPALVLEIDKAGHEIGYHSYYHFHIDKLLENGTFKEDLNRGLGILESITGKKITSYRAPYFSFANEPKPVVEALLNAGIKNDSSIIARGGKQAWFQHAEPFVFAQGEQQLFEFPLNRQSLFQCVPVSLGSGYFRILPLRLITQMMKKSTYNMVYFHPRDFDVDAPFSSRLSLGRNLLNRIGTKQAANKLDILLSEFKFSTIGEAQDILSTNPTEVPIFKLK